MTNSKPRRSKEEIAGDELMRVAEANKARQTRLIDNNLELQKAIREMQPRYQFPVRSLNDWNKWYFQLAEQDIDTIIKFQDEVHNLAIQFGVVEFEERVKWTVVFGKPLIASYSMGFPRVSGGWGKDGKLTFKIEITSETQVNNVIVQDYIQSLTSSLTLTSDPPPKPQKDRHNTRKLDWLPLYEWHHRHPEFSYAEIAQAIGYAARTVKNKLSEFTK